jgi:glutaminyl-peptide cyclotransferase
MKLYSITFLFILSIVSAGSCNQKGSEPGRTRQQRQQTQKITTLQLPVSGDRFVAGQEIPVLIGAPDTLKIDSVELFLHGRLAVVYDGADTAVVSTAGMNPGKTGVRARLHFEGGSSETHSVQVELLSDIEPKKYRYRVINSFPHDVGAYTQGLMYYDGWIYEGTGNYNQSSVRKVRLSNGEVIQSRNNASNIFGEGITIFDGKLYQLTYKSQICFVYDLNTFEEIKKFYYQNKEGWGLTNSEDELIMSDGTNIIYFIDPAMFTVKRQIEVYNNEGPVADLNELEYINGKIFANRFYTDEIVIIDPQTGKEEGRVDMKGILSVKDRKPSTNVLNGIAWDPIEERLFVTGKYWPKLFEIELVPIQDQ